VELSNPGAEIFVPDGVAPGEALARTTHLAVGAHPDDVAVMALHGILECFRRPDRWFAAVTVTDGAGSPRSGAYADLDDEAMRRVRAAEEKEAATLGEYGAAVLLDHPSPAAKDATYERVVADLAAVLAVSQPGVVYAHNLADRHDTHVAVALRTVEALRRLPAEDRPRVVYGCEVWRDLDWLDPADRVMLDVSAHPELGTALLEVYDSQIAGGKRYDRAVVGRRTAHATFSASHAVDEVAALTYAMELTPLVEDDALDPARFVEGHIARLQADVADRILRLAGHDRRTPGDGVTTS
jgi:LmbE family N-acetylglucosaminyl deacetylase